MAFARRPAKNKTPINRSPCTTGSPPGGYVDPPRWRWRSWRSRQSKPASYVARNFSRQLRFHRAKILHFRHFAQRNENEAQKVVFFVCLFVIFIVSCVVRSP